MDNFYLALICLLKRYIYFEEEVYYHLLACFIIQSYIYHIFESTGIMWLLYRYTSSTNTILKCLHLLGKNSITLSGFSEDALICEISNIRRLVIINGPRILESSDTKRIILAASRKGANIIKCKKGNQKRTIKYKPYVMFAVANEKGPTEKELISSCIFIPVNDVPGDAIIEKFVGRIANIEALPIKQAIKRFAKKVEPDVKEKYPTYNLSFILPRQSPYFEILEPLIITAEYIDKEFPELEVKNIICAFATRYINNFELKKRLEDLDGTLASVILEYTENHNPDKEVDGKKYYREDSLLAYLKENGGEFAWVSSKRLRQIMNSHQLISNEPAPRKTFNKFVDNKPKKIWRTCLSFEINKLKEFVTKRLGNTGNGGKNGPDGFTSEIPHKTA